MNLARMLFLLNDSFFEEEIKICFSKYKAIILMEWSNLSICQTFSVSAVRYLRTKADIILFYSNNCISRSALPVLVCLRIDFLNSKACNLLKYYLHF